MKRKFIVGLVVVFLLVSISAVSVYYAWLVQPKEQYTADEFEKFLIYFEGDWIISQFASYGVYPEPETIEIEMDFDVFGPMLDPFIGSWYDYDGNLVYFLPPGTEPHICYPCDDFLIIIRSER